MSGIAGRYNPDGLSDDRENIIAMSEKIIHRGPDGEGYHIDSKAHMAVRRLAIIDPEGGSQPMYAAEGRYCIVYDGELYNYKEIRKELQEKGHVFTSSSDTEVILKSYMEWGKSCLLKFRGMYAFCIRDIKADTIFLVRDRMGIKPLYYAKTRDGTFVFASEIKAILAHDGIGASLYLPALDNLFSFAFCVAPYTFFEGIKQVLPGTWLEVSRKGIIEKEYWDIDIHGSFFDASFSDIACQLNEELRKAVRYSMVSDIPVATYLSGGIDSSAVTGICSALSNRKISTISITFDESGYEESSYARHIAARFATKHHEFKCSVTEEDVFKFVYAMEDPLSSLLSLPLYMLSRKARELGFKAVLSGDGSDEILAGYDYFKLIKSMDFIGRGIEGGCRVNILRSIFPGLQNRIQADIQHMFLKRFPVYHPAFPYRFNLYPDKEKLFSKEYLKKYSEGDRQELFFFDVNKLDGAPFLNQALYMETKMRLLNLTLPLSDKMSMANSVEVRPCFLDHDFVNFVFKIPPEYKLSVLNEKHILKESMRGFLPDAVRLRKKQPLQPPGQWFIKTIKPLVEHYLSKEVTESKGYFNHIVTDKLLKNSAEESMVLNAIAVTVLFVHMWDDIFICNNTN